MKRRSRSSRRSSRSARRRHGNSEPLTSGVFEAAPKTLKLWREVVNAHRRTRWDPEKDPYRAELIAPSSAPGLHGWSSEVAVFPNEQEAVEWFEFFTTKLRGALGARVDVYVPPTRGRPWTWKSLRSWRPSRGRRRP